MGRRLRVFVSSTMRDLRNERRAVCRRLAEFNFEPVNAEEWAPGGDSSWGQIREEIEASDIFVLLLGDRYGWIPEIGPESEHRLSVTHLEYHAAVDHELPILPFLRNLDYDAERDTDDARRR